MLGALDIGNSRIKAALYDDDLLVARRVVPTLEWETATDVERFLRSFLDRSVTRGARVSLGVACVVPSAEKLLTEALLAVPRLIRLPAVFVGAQCRLNLTIGVRHPERLGGDRIADAVAAVELFGSPVIAVGCGTAATVTVVDGKRTLLGGAIAPGPRIAAQALASNTGRLPLVQTELDADASLPPPIGRDTEQAIQAGLVHGLLGTLWVLISKARAELGANAPVAVTGGYGEFVARMLGDTCTYREDLTLEGIRTVVKLNSEGAY